MVRSIRIEYPGAFYHIKARGNRRESLAASNGLRAFGFTDTAKGRMEWLNAARPKKKPRTAASPPHLLPSALERWVKQSPDVA